MLLRVTITRSRGTVLLCNIMHTFHTFVTRLSLIFRDRCRTRGMSSRKRRSLVRRYRLSTSRRSLLCLYLVIESTRTLDKPNEALEETVREARGAESRSHERDCNSRVNTPAFLAVHASRVTRHSRNDNILTRHLNGRGIFSSGLPFHYVSWYDAKWCGIIALMTASATERRVCCTDEFRVLRRCGKKHNWLSFAEIFVRR